MLRPSLAFLVLLILTDSARAQHLAPTPGLKSGETFVYQIDASGSRSTQVESRVVTPQSPPAESLNATCLLQVHVEEATPSGVRLKTYLSDKSIARSSQNPSTADAISTPDKPVEVLISAGGTASEVKGLDQLTPAQRNAWGIWLNRFTAPMAFPKSGVRRGQRWQSVEPETAASPISELSWQRKYGYIKQDVCPGLDRKARTESCAVVFVQAQLRQKSSPKNATPPDYKLRGLVTSGTATGTNETVLYISTTTGLLVRSTEDAEQSMDATVALADGSNQVHYLVHAKSHSQIQLLPDAPQDVR